MVFLRAAVLAKGIPGDRTGSRGWRIDSIDKIDEASKEDEYCGHLDSYRLPV